MPDKSVSLISADRTPDIGLIVTRPQTSPEAIKSVWYQDASSGGECYQILFADSHESDDSYFLIQHQFETVQITFQAANARYNQLRRVLKMMILLEYLSGDQNAVAIISLTITLKPELEALIQARHSARSSSLCRRVCGERCFHAPRVGRRG